MIECIHAAYVSTVMACAPGACSHTEIARCSYDECKRAVAILTDWIETEQPVFVYVDAPACRPVMISTTGVSDADTP